MRKEELTPEERKRLLEMEELKDEFREWHKKTVAAAEKFHKRAAAYMVVRGIKEDEPKKEMTI